MSLSPQGTADDQAVETIHCVRQADATGDLKHAPGALHFLAECVGPVSG
jgi:hypothetical protein